MCVSLPTPKELKAHSDGSMVKAKTAHKSHSPIPLLKGDSNHSLAVKNTKLLEQDSNPRLAGWKAVTFTTVTQVCVCVCVCVCVVCVCV